MNNLRVQVSRRWPEASHCPPSGRPQHHLEPKSQQRVKGYPQCKGNLLRLPRRPITGQSRRLAALGVAVLSTGLLAAVAAPAARAVAGNHSAATAADGGRFPDAASLLPGLLAATRPGPRPAREDE